MARTDKKPTHSKTKQSKKSSNTPSSKGKKRSSKKRNTPKKTAPLQPTPKPTRTPPHSCKIIKVKGQKHKFAVAVKVSLSAFQCCNL